MNTMWEQLQMDREIRRQIKFCLLLILVIVMFWFIPKHSIDNSINNQLYQIQQDVSYIREYLEKRELKLSFYFPQKLNFDYILLT